MRRHASCEASARSPVFVTAAFTAAAAVAAGCPGESQTRETKIDDEPGPPDPAESAEVEPDLPDEAPDSQAEPEDAVTDAERTAEKEPLAGGPGKDPLELSVAEALLDATMTSHCEGEPPCRCPGTDVVGMKDYADGARVDLTEGDVPELVVDTTGCAPRHGASLAIFRADGQEPMATSQPELVESSFHAALGSCRIVPFRGERDALACGSSSTHQGQRFSSASLIAEVEGEIQTIGIESYKHPGGSCLFYDGAVEAARLRDIEILLYPDDGVVAELEVERVRGEIPEEYDGDYCAATEDGWELPELQIETDRYELREDTFERLDK